ncbi:unnamed protein product [Closterium sp. Yama58-4]|nr:unnamed protein product [Closterium sp. Yama58-4]
MELRAASSKSNSVPQNTTAMASTTALTLRSVPSLQTPLLHKKPDVLKAPRCVSGSRTIFAWADKPQQQQQSQQKSQDEKQMLRNLWDPFFPANSSLTQLLDSVDRMFDDALLPPMPRFPSLFRVTSPRLDMPGLSKEEVSVKLENGDLLIRGEHKAQETAGEEGEGLRDARVAKSYQITLAVPDSVLAEHVKAEMNNGVLTLTIAKVAPPEPAPAAAVEIPVA